MDSRLKKPLEEAETLGGRVQSEVAACPGRICSVPNPVSPLLPPTHPPFPPLLFLLLPPPSWHYEASLLHHDHNVLPHCRSTELTDQAMGLKPHSKSNLLSPTLFFSSILSQKLETSTLTQSMIICYSICYLSKMKEMGKYLNKSLTAHMQVKAKAWYCYPSIATSI